MNMFARFDENPAMTLQDIKETKHYGQTHRRENSIPTTNKVCGGIIRTDQSRMTEKLLKAIFSPNATEISWAS